ncbi:hypothetical protein Peur_035849 [Populus x canadensis]
MTRRLLTLTRFLLFSLPSLPPPKPSSLAKLHSNPTKRHIADNLPCITQPFINISDQSQITQAVSSLQLLSRKGIRLPCQTLAYLFIFLPS